MTASRPSVGRSLLASFALIGVSILASCGPADSPPSPPAPTKTASTDPAPAAAPAASPAAGATPTSGAGPAASAAAPAAAPADEAPPADAIVIGHYGSLTGAEATFGISTDNGIRLAVEEVNAKGGVNGKQIVLKTYDDQGKLQEAGTAVTRLITEDKAVAVLGEVASSRSIAGGNVCQQYGVPMISPSSTNVRVTQIGDKISRVCFIDSFQGYVVARFARESDKVKASKVAILYDQSQPYSKGLKDDFKKAFLQLGGTIVAEEAYTGGDQDFSAQITTIRDLKPDAVFVPGYYTDAATIAVQARKLGVTVPLLGGDGWDSAELAKLGGQSIEGCFYSNHYAPDQEGERVKAFLAAYGARFKDEAGKPSVPDGLAALGYDAAKILFAAMERAPSLKGEDLAKAIASTKDYPGVTGIISMDADRNARKPAVVVEMRGGVPRWVATIDPAK